MFCSTVIKPSHKPDWFVADRGAVEPIFGVPGIQLTSALDHFEIHRSHLALLENDEAVRYLSDRAEPCWSQRDAKTEPLGFKLRTTQHQAVDFIRTRRGTLLGDEQRVGKTLAAAYSHEPHLGRLVVIAPLMVREVWLGWLRRIFPGEGIGVMTGRVFDEVEAAKPIVFGHYDILYGWQSGKAIGTLVLDEAHCLTNRHSRRARAAVLLASCAERVIAATGTPIGTCPRACGACSHSSRRARSAATTNSASATRHPGRRPTVHATPASQTVRSFRSDSPR